MAATPIKTERLSKDSGLSRLGLPTPSTPYASSPLTPNGTRPRLGPRRQSRFTEDMTDRTPAASISERSMDYYWYGPSAEDVRTSINTNRTSVNTNTNTNTSTNNINVSSHSASDLAVPEPGPDPVEEKPEVRNRRREVARYLNCALHALPCLALLGIMGYAMRVLRDDIESYMGIQAIILIALFGADVILDVFSLFRARKPWPTWGLVIRSICGIGYIALFLVYVGLGGPFPEGYTYWRIGHEFAAPVVYILLCVTGLWNLLHIPLCRYQLGSTLLGPSTTTPTPPPTSPTTLNNRTSFNPRFSTAGTERSSISMTWRGWIRTRSTQCNNHSREDLERAVSREGSADRTLREHPGEDDEDGAGSSRVASSYKANTGEGKLSEETVRPAVGG